MRAIGRTKLQEQKVINTPAPLVCIPVRNCAELRDWQERLGLSYEDAALHLGVDRSTYAAYLSGKSRATGMEVPLPRAIALAAMAIEAGLFRALPAPVARPKRKRAGQ